MQNRQMFSEYMAAFSELYDKEVTPVLSKIYWQTLKPHSDAQCKKGFEAAIKTCSFFPKPAELIELIDVNQSDQAARAWFDALDAVRLHGSYATTDDLEKIKDPLIMLTIKAMGGWSRFCSMETREQPFRQKEFEETYLTLKAKGPMPKLLKGGGNKAVQIRDNRGMETAGSIAQETLKLVKRAQS